MKAFDSYHKWLGIPPEEQPPNHYRLLGLRQFEDDRDVIDTLSTQRMESIRKYQSGRFAADSQRILTELARARRCLLDPARKAAYDRELEAVRDATGTDNELVRTIRPDAETDTPVVSVDTAGTAVSQTGSGVAITPKTAVPSPVKLISHPRARHALLMLGQILFCGLAIFGLVRVTSSQRSFTGLGPQVELPRQVVPQVALSPSPTNQEPQLQTSPTDPSELQRYWAKTNDLAHTLMAPNEVRMVLIPQAEVQIPIGKGKRRRLFSQGFYLSSMVISQGQWKSAMGTSPWAGRQQVMVSDNHPAVCVSRLDVAEFCERLTQQARALSEKPYIHGHFRLPTRDEWEFAGRALDCAAQPPSPLDIGLARVAGQSSSFPVLQLITPIGDGEPNAFGVYGLGGNIGELVHSSDQRMLDAEPNDSTGFRIVWDFNNVLVEQAASDRWFTPHRAQTAREKMIREVAWPERRKTSLSQELAIVPPGSYSIISQGKAPHQITVANAFYIGTTEVTQSEWRVLMETHPWRGRPEVDEQDQLPAVFIGLEDALEFCERLTSKDRQAGLIPNSARYRLPTEAEWEHASRCGWSSRWSCGDTAQTLSNVAHSSTFQQTKKPRPVGLQSPNVWGIRDLYGNVAEWCFNQAGGRTQLGSGDGGTTSALRDRNGAVRGGSIADRADLCSSDGRQVHPVSWTTATVGFRVVLELLAPTETNAESALLRPRQGSDQPAILKSPFTPHQAQSAQLAWARYLKRPVVQENRLGMRMALIPPGEFGYGVSEAERRNFASSSRDDELALAWTVIGKPFLISETELSVAQMKRFIELNPGFQTKAEKRNVFQAWNPAANNLKGRGDWMKPGFDQTDEHPCVMISRYDVKAICDWLNEESVEAYRIPMEQEWEFACRGGTQSPFWFGESDVEYLQFVNGLSGSMGPGGRLPALRDEPDGYVFTARCGSFPPNAFGLYDMSGNVWEWCAASNAGKTGGTFAVRGGGFNSDEGNYLRSAHRAFFEGTDGWALLGARLAASLEAAEP